MRDLLLQLLAKEDKRGTIQSDFVQMTETLNIDSRHVSDVLAQLQSLSNPNVLGDRGCIETLSAASRRYVNN